MNESPPVSSLLVGPFGRDAYERRPAFTAVPDASFDWRNTQVVAAPAATEVLTIVT